MTDADRETFITDCGRRINEAYSKGDRQMARGLVDMRTQAIKGRSAAQVAAMERDYFSEEGERARLAARTGGALHA